MRQCVGSIGTLRVANHVLVCDHILNLQLLRCWKCDDFVPSEKQLILTQAPKVFGSAGQVSEYSLHVSQCWYRWHLMLAFSLAGAVARVQEIGLQQRKAWPNTLAYLN